MKNKTVMSDIVIISDNERIEKYTYSILLRMQPRVYNQYNQIKLQFSAHLMGFAEQICDIMRSAGLIVESKEKKKIKVRAGYILPDAYEIILTKIPILEMQKE